MELTVVCAKDEDRSCGDGSGWLTLTGMVLVHTPSY